MNKLMRMIVFFDLPTNTKSERRAAHKFREFLLKDGYYMLQYSVYARICNGYDSVCTHTRRVKQNVPQEGSIRLLTITEKQYEKMTIILGEKKRDEEPIESNLTTVI